ncbi:MAG: GyrI-like domain-containing protein [Oscillospiraceae bacterium]|jgi:effector-binding domain-containing protein|nr:GyrI-like domain-containing protein [Oscillospiraceae bacterium]
MPRVSDITLLQKRKQPTLFVRTTTQVEQLPALIGKSYAAMAAYLSELSETLSDIPYVAYHNMDMQNLDVEIGFPVARVLPAKGNIQAGLLPAEKVVFCMYRGAYGEMTPVYAEMARWTEDNALEPTGIVYEYYYNGPDFPESELLTKIVMPVK